MEPTSLMFPALSGRFFFLPLAPSTYEENTICHFPDSRKGEEKMDGRQILRDILQFCSQETQFSGGESILRIMRKGSHLYRDFREQETGSNMRRTHFHKSLDGKKKERKRY